jgi:sugar phosphate isomerase/epimerase
MAHDRARNRCAHAKPGWSRRDLLAATGALLALQAAPSLATNERPFFHAARLAGLQFLSVLDALATDRDATFVQIAGLGYRTVETVTTVPGTAAEIRDGLDAAGLAWRSGHYFPETVPGLERLNFSNDLSRIIDDAGVIGLDYAVMAFAPAPAHLGGPATGEDPGRFFARITPQPTVDDWRWVADSLNRTGVVFARSGLRLAYHNHDRELARYGADSALEIASDSIRYLSRVRA